MGADDLCVSTMGGRINMGAFGEFRLGFWGQKTLESCELPSNFLSGFTILSRAPWCRLWLEICLVGICQDSPF